MELLLDQDGISADALNVKALADAAGITRSALYSDHYSPLKDEFLRRAQALSAKGPQQNYDSDKLLRRIKRLESRLRQQTTAAEELKLFRTQAISRIAAQHEALLRCRGQDNYKGADERRSHKASIRPESVTSHPDRPTF
ncbi:hypothetical protein C9424_02330 [Arthrobacter sp. H-02-3]|nr:hypothetical protein C9424_02330 [Arthrobacter sp. H-02-3]